MKSIGLVIMVVLSFIIGFNAEVLSSVEVFSKLEITEKLKLFEANIYEVSIFLAVLCILIVLFFVIDFVSFRNRANEQKALVSANELINNQYQEILELEKENTRLSKHVEEVEHDKNYLDESLSKLDELATLIEQSPMLIKGIADNNQVVVDNSEKLDSLILTLSKFPNSQEELDMKLIIRDIDLANTITMIEEALNDNDLEFRHNKTVELLLKLNDVFGVESKEFVLMSWVIGNVLAESHNSLTSDFGEKLVSHTSVIFPKLNDLAEDAVVPGLNPNYIKEQQK